MNPSFPFACKKFLPLLLAGVLLSNQIPEARAGVVLGNNRQAMIGAVVEGGASISLQTQYGAVEYQKNTVMWYSADRDIDTLLKAAQKAKGEGVAAAAIILYELSISKEPATQSQAKTEMAEVRSSQVSQAMTSAGSAYGNTSDVASLPPEERLIRGNQMVDNGNTYFARQYMDDKSRALGHSTGQQLIADGNVLIAQAKREIAAAKAKRDAELAAEVARLKAEEDKQREIQKTMQAAKEVIEKVQRVSEWTPEDKKVNLCVALGLAILALIALWQITMKEVTE